MQFYAYLHGTAVSLAASY